jgi:hypothetical protein
MVKEGTIDPSDFQRLIVSDSPEEVVRSIAGTCMHRFGLTYAKRMRPSWLLGEDSPSSSGT